MLFQHRSIDVVENWNFCFSSEKTEHCIKLSGNSDLYECLKVIPIYDSLITKYSFYHDDNMDGLSVKDNQLSFSSNCKLANAYFRDSYLTLQLDTILIKIDDNIQEIMKIYPNSTNEWRNHSNYVDDTSGAILLFLKNGSYLSINYRDMKIKSIELKTEM